MPGSGGCEHSGVERRGHGLWRDGTMGAGATSLLPEHWPQLFWDRGRVPGTKGRYPPLGLTVDHGIPWHTMAYHGPRWESGRHFGELCHSRSRKGWPLGFGQWPQLNGHLLGKMRNQCVKGYHGLPYFGHIWTPYLWNFFHWYNHWGPGTSWRVWAEEAKENGVWAAFWEKESGNVGPAA